MQKMDWTIISGIVVVVATIAIVLMVNMSVDYIMLVITVAMALVALFVGFSTTVNARTWNVILTVTNFLIIFGSWWLLRHAH